VTVRLMTKKETTHDALAASKGGVAGVCMQVGRTSRVRGLRGFVGKPPFFGAKALSTAHSLFSQTDQEPSVPICGTTSRSSA
jgi:hypothetical protein